jgi:hypothetical protein
MTARQPDLHEMNGRILLMKKTAEELKAMAGQFPAVFQNTNRILASIKMLEINVSEVLDVEDPTP